MWHLRARLRVRVCAAAVCPRAAASPLRAGARRARVRCRHQNAPELLRQGTLQSTVRISDHMRRARHAPAHVFLMAQVKSNGGTASEMSAPLPGWARGRGSARPSFRSRSRPRCAAACGAGAAEITQRIDPLRRVGAGRASPALRATGSASRRRLTLTDCRLMAPRHGLRAARAEAEAKLRSTVHGRFDLSFGGAHARSHRPTRDGRSDRARGPQTGRATARSRLAPFPSPPPSRGTRAERRAGQLELEPRLSTSPSDSSPRTQPSPSGARAPSGQKGVVSGSPAALARPFCAVASWRARVARWSARASERVLPPAGRRCRRPRGPVG